MVNDVSQRLNAFREYSVASYLPGRNPFKLSCWFDQPADEDEILSAWPKQNLPQELRHLWLTSRQARLFQDVQFGQWGLVLFSPDAAAWCTVYERAERPHDFHADDIVFGEFSGDSDLLVTTASPVGETNILVATPLDPRQEWAHAASSLSQFLARYLEALGGKYWEERFWGELLQV